VIRALWAFTSTVWSADCFVESFLLAATSVFWLELTSLPKASLAVLSASYSLESLASSFDVIAFPESVLSFSSAVYLSVILDSAEISAF